MQAEMEMFLPEVPAGGQYFRSKSHWPPALSEQSKRYARSITPDHSKRHDAMNGLGDSTRSADSITRHDAFTERAENDPNTNTDRDPRSIRSSLVTLELLIPAGAIWLVTSSTSRAGNQSKPHPIRRHNNDPEDTK
jgi:hypothetical protein